MGLLLRVFEYVGKGELTIESAPNFIKSALEAAGFANVGAVEKLGRVLGLDAKQITEAFKTITADVPVSEQMEKLGAALGKSPKEMEVAAKALGKSDEDFLAGLKADVKSAEPKVAANDAGAPKVEASEPIPAAGEGFSPKQWARIKQKIAGNEKLTAKEIVGMSPTQIQEAEALGARAAQYGQPVDTRSFLGRYPIIKYGVAWPLAATAVSGVIGAGGLAVDAFVRPQDVPVILNTVRAIGSGIMGAYDYSIGDEEAAKKRFKEMAQYGGEALVVNKWLTDGIIGFFSSFLPPMLANWLGTAVSQFLISHAKPLVSSIAQLAGFETKDIDIFNGKVPTVDPLAKPVGRVAPEQLAAMSEDVKNWQHTLQKNGFPAIEMNGKLDGETVLATKQLLNKLHFYNGTPDKVADVGMVQAMINFNSGSNPANRGIMGMSMLTTLAGAAGLPAPSPVAAPTQASQSPGPQQITQGNTTGKFTEQEFIQYAIGAPITGKLDDVTTVAAIAAFQRKNGIVEEPGQLGEKTLETIMKQIEQKHAGQQPEKAALEIAAAIAAQKTAEAAARGATTGTQGVVKPVADASGTLPDQTPNGLDPLAQKKTSGLTTPDVAAQLPAAPTSLAGKAFRAVDDGMRATANGVISTFGGVAHFLSFGYIPRFNTDDLVGMGKAVAAGDIDWKTGEVQYQKSVALERARSEQAKKEIGKGYDVAETVGEGLSLLATGGATAIGKGVTALTASGIGLGSRSGSVALGSVSAFLIGEPVVAAAAEASKPPLDTPNPPPAAGGAAPGRPAPKSGS